MPTWAPINIYKFWARSTIIPLLVISHHKPVFPLPNGIASQNDFLDELWCSCSQAYVPYAQPLKNIWRMDLFEYAFAVIDKVLSYLNGLRGFFLRKHTRALCINWILDHQEPTGDWAGIFPPMHTGLLALYLEGYVLESDVVQRGLRAVERFAWQDEGGKRIQACVSPVWDTILMTVGLVDSGIDESDNDMIRAVDWIKARQILGPEGDWRVYRPHVVPGGFSFEYFNTWYPDVDDTAAALLAFLKQNPESASSHSVMKAVHWIIGMQNDDGGWAAFDVNNNKFYLNRIPFSDMDSLCDPSTADVTGRILEAFGLLLVSKKTLSLAATDLSIIIKVEAAVKRGIAYLHSTQEPSGAFYGRWGSNYIYGTSNVLCGLMYFEENPDVQLMVHRGINWLLGVQNIDGGFGEVLETYRYPERAGHGPSTASQTAWGAMGLLARLAPTEKAISSSITWLIPSQTEKTETGATWPEAYYTGTGFPNYFYLQYSYYSHYFPMMALGRYWKARTSR